MDANAEYKHLKPKPGSCYRQLFVNGRIMAEVLYRETVGREPLTPEEVAQITICRSKQCARPFTIASIIPRSSKPTGRASQLTFKRTGASAGPMSRVITSRINESVPGRR